jgi:hypothetical protein
MNVLSGLNPLFFFTNLKHGFWYQSFLVLAFEQASFQTVAAA